VVSGARRPSRRRRRDPPGHPGCMICRATTATRTVVVGQDGRPLGLQQKQAVCRPVDPSRSVRAGRTSGVASGGPAEQRNFAALIRARSCGTSSGSVPDRPALPRRIAESRSAPPHCSAWVPDSSFPLLSGQSFSARGSATTRRLPTLTGPRFSDMDAICRRDQRTRTEPHSNVRRCCRTCLPSGV
jgi:hypothetical protein